MEELNDIDAIVAQTEASSNQEIPMESDATPPAPETPAIQEYEFQANGQTIKAPVEKILRWASMGYAAPNKIGELAKKLSDYEGRFKQYEQYEKTYKPVDEWARSNPDKWQDFLGKWQQAQYGVMPQGQTTPQEGQSQAAPQLPPELIQKLQAHEQFIQETQQEKVQQRERLADQTLDGEIQSIRKQFSNIDFDAPDQKGNSLEFQILEHATKNGIPSFRAAFRDYCFDHLAKFSEEKGREATGVSPKTKAGLLGKEQAPATRSRMPDLKGRNYDQIHELILAQELGISG